MTMPKDAPAKLEETISKMHQMIDEMSQGGVLPAELPYSSVIDDPRHVNVFPGGRPVVGDEVVVGKKVYNADSVDFFANFLYELREQYGPLSDYVRMAEHIICRIQRETGMDLVSTSHWPRDCNGSLLKSGDWVYVNNTNTLMVVETITLSTQPEADRILLVEPGTRGNATRTPKFSSTETQYPNPDSMLFEQLELSGPEPF